MIKIKVGLKGMVNKGLEVKEKKANHNCIFFLHQSHKLLINSAMIQILDLKQTQSTPL